MKNNSIFRDPSHLRKMPEYVHNNINKVRIMGFWSAKSMVELICHILENVKSLECLTLDTMYDMNYAKCTLMDSHMITEVRNALLAVEKYIVGKVPSKVKFNVLQPFK
jgi:hypothetical protein